MKVIELFSGIGAQVAALKRLGIDYEVVGISEIDKYAIKSYEAINGATHNYGDISQIPSLDYADLWTYSFPCQDLSSAGKQAGIKEGTRSGLLLHVERLLNNAVNHGKQPKYLLLENVKPLVGKKFKPDFNRWLDKLEQLGYNNYWKVLNSKDYGIPQNRERVFVVSIRKDVDTEGYVFPSPIKLEKRLKDMLEPYVAEKYYLSDEKVVKFAKNFNDKEINNTIRCGGGGSLDGKHTFDIVFQKNSYRRLTPKECWRLMGFTDDEFEKAKDSGVSNTQLYKQAGNSIVVNVLEAIFRQIFYPEKVIYDKDGQMLLF